MDVTEEEEPEKMLCSCLIDDPLQLPCLSLCLSTWHDRFHVYLCRRSSPSSPPPAGRIAVAAEITVISRPFQC